MKQKEFWGFVICAILIISMFSTVSAKWQWPWQKDNADLSPQVSAINFKCPYGLDGETKEIDEKSLNVINGLSLALKNAEESNFELNATLIPQAGRITLGLGGENTSIEKFSIINLNGESYLIELAGASDSSATLKVTDSKGNSEQKEINEGNSKKIGRLTIFLLESDENHFELKALIIPGLNEFSLTTRGNKITSNINGVNTIYTVKLVSAQDHLATLNVTCKNI